MYNLSKQEANTSSTLMPGLHKTLEPQTETDQREELSYPFLPPVVVSLGAQLAWTERCLENWKRVFRYVCGISQWDIGQCSEYDRY